MRSSGTDWPAYLARFHAEHAGITEALLTRTAARGAGGVDPYAWAAAALPPAGTVLDIACGSAPLARHVAHDRWSGIDRSPAELALAADRVGAGRLAEADAADLPADDGSADAVAVLMGLMLLQPLAAVQAEVVRVLRPGGRLVALLPTRLPQRPTDVLRWGAVFAALGMTGAAWPNPEVLGDHRGWLHPELRVLDDATRTFDLPLDRAGDAELLVRSLYLPDAPPARVDRAVAVASRWIGRRIGVPLRRIVAERR